MSVGEDSPSASRRKALKEADAANQLRVLETCPLSKYMDIADRLLDRFQDAVDGRRLDEAYVFGLRFANMCLSSLPQHPEWKHVSSSKDRKRVTSQVGDVLCMMDVIKQRMDAEELAKIKAQILAKEAEEARKKEIEDRRKHQLDEEHQREQKIMNALEQERAQFLAEQQAQREEEIKKKLLAKKKLPVAKKKETTTKKKKESTAKKEEIEKSAMAKLQAMQARMSSMDEHEAAGKVTATTSKKNSEQSKIIETKAKEGKQKNGKTKKANYKSKEEKATLPSPSPTQPSEIEDDTTTLHAPSVAEKTAILTSVENQESKAELKDTQKKPVMIASKKKSKKESHPSKETESSPDIASTGSAIESTKQDTDSVKSVKSKKGPMKIIKSKIGSIKNPKTESKPSKEIESSPDTSSTGSAIEPTKKDSDSVRSVKAKKAPMKFIKSKIDSAKSSIAVSNEKPKKESESSKKIESALDTVSTGSAIEPTTKDSDSARSKKAKKAPMKFIKSKIDSAKSSIPSTILKPSAKISANDSVDKASATIIAPIQTPRSREETAVIDKLKRTISVQEDRLEEIEGKQIPSLLKAAKTFLKKDKKKEALKCLAHKKRLERQVDTMKAAVFNMETQMFMLESALEDRYVKKALDEAASAMAGFQQNIGDPKAAVVDLTDMTASLPELDVGDSTDEELMEELEEWLSSDDKKKLQDKESHANDEDFSLLSMPSFLPAAPVATPTSPVVDRILEPVIGA